MLIECMFYSTVIFFYCALLPSGVINNDDDHHHQGGVSSPVLFALYIDGVISELKLSGHGVCTYWLSIYRLCPIC